MQVALRNRVQSTEGELTLVFVCFTYEIRTMFAMPQILHISLDVATRPVQAIAHCILAKHLQVYLLQNFS